MPVLLTLTVQPVLVSYRLIGDHTGHPVIPEVTPVRRCVRSPGIGVDSASQPLLVSSCGNGILGLEPGMRSLIRHEGGRTVTHVIDDRGVEAHGLGRVDCCEVEGVDGDLRAHPQPVEALFPSVPLRLIPGSLL